MVYADPSQRGQKIFPAPEVEQANSAHARAVERNVAMDEFRKVIGQFSGIRGRPSSLSVVFLMSWFCRGGRSRRSSSSLASATIIDAIRERRCLLARVRGEARTFLGDWMVSSQRMRQAYFDTRHT